MQNSTSNSSFSSSNSKKEQLSLGESSDGYLLNNNPAPKQQQVSDLSVKFNANMSTKALDVKLPPKPSVFLHSSKTITLKKPGNYNHQKRVNESKSFGEPDSKRSLQSSSNSGHSNDWKDLYRSDSDFSFKNLKSYSEITQTEGLYVGRKTIYNCLRQAVSNIHKFKDRMDKMKDTENLLRDNKTSLESQLFQANQNSQNASSLAFQWQQAYTTLANSQMNVDPDTESIQTLKSDHQKEIEKLEKYINELKSKHKVELENEKKKFQEKEANYRKSFSNDKASLRKEIISWKQKFDDEQKKKHQLRDEFAVFKTQAKNNQKTSELEESIKVKNEELDTSKAQIESLRDLSLVAIAHFSFWHRYVLGLKSSLKNKGYYLPTYPKSNDDYIYGPFGSKVVKSRVFLDGVYNMSIEDLVFALGNPDSDFSTEIVPEPLIGDYAVKIPVDNNSKISAKTIEKKPENISMQTTAKSSPLNYKNAVLKQAPKPKQNPVNKK